MRALERVPGFPDILIHEYVALDLDRVVEALDELEPIEQFLGIVADIERTGGESGVGGLQVDSHLATRRD